MFSTGSNRKARDTSPGSMLSCANEWRVNDTENIGVATLNPCWDEALGACQRERAKIDLWVETGPILVNVSELFIRRPIATSLLMLGIALFGVVAYRALPVAELPTVDFPTLSVTATLPGAD